MKKAPGNPGPRMEPYQRWIAYFFFFVAFFAPLLAFLVALFID